ncbi:hypothetical protein U1Q18_049312 [Sarracenia purpurea var. burkii]
MEWVDERVREEGRIQEDGERVDAGKDRKGGKELGGRSRHCRGDDEERRFCKSDLTLLLEVDSSSNYRPGCCL